jgi:hypothetical protein
MLRPAVGVPPILGQQVGNLAGRMIGQRRRARRRADWEIDVVASPLVELPVVPTVTDAGESLSGRLVAFDDGLRLFQGRHKFRPGH